LLADEVAAAPPECQAALRDTLYKIEIARSRAKTPIEGAILAYLMMCESTSRLRTEINHLHYLISSIQATLIIERVQRQSRNML